MKNLLLTLILLSLPLVMVGREPETQIVHLKKCKRDIEITKYNNVVAIDFQDEIPIRELIKENNKKFDMELVEGYSLLAILDYQKLMIIVSKIISRKKMNLLRDEIITFSTRAEPQGKIVSVSFWVSQKVFDILSFEDMCKLNLRIKKELKYDHPDKDKDIPYIQRIEMLRIPNNGTEKE